MSQKTKEMMTPEYRLKLSKKLKETSKNRGKCMTNEQKQKLRDAANKYWNSLSREEKQIKTSHLHNSIISKKPRKPLIQYNIKHYKKVIQKDLSGNIINTYPSISSAAKIVKLPHSSISRVCRKVEHCKTAGGFIWEFV